MSFPQKKKKKKKNRHKHSLLSTSKMKSPTVETGVHHSVVCLEIPKTVDWDKNFQNVETLQPKG